MRGTRAMFITQIGGKPPIIPADAGGGSVAPQSGVQEGGASCVFYTWQKARLARFAPRRSSLTRSSRGTTKCHFKPLARCPHQRGGSPLRGRCFLPHPPTPGGVPPDPPLTPTRQSRWCPPVSEASSASIASGCKSKIHAVGVHQSRNPGDFELVPLSCL